ncbi:MAG: BMP family ABC transporter substrate-binding protein, partial [Anaerolineae bacterium]
MRKFVLTLLSLLTVFSLLAACGPAPTEAPAEEATEPPAAEPTEPPMEEEEPFKAGMVTDVG